MQFNPVANMQTQEIIISTKLEKEVHPEIVFNNSPVVRSVCHVKEKLENDKNSQYCNKTTFYSAQVQHSDCISHLLDDIWTMEMSYMTNPTVSHSVRKLKAYNIKHAWGYY